MRTRLELNSAPDSVLPLIEKAGLDSAFFYF